MKNLSLLFILSILAFQTQIFGQQHARIKSEQVISQTIYLTYGIISRSPEIIKGQYGDKIYLDKRCVEKKEQDGLGGIIHIDSKNEVYLPLIMSDEYGYYTSVSRDYWDKPFHQFCNDCKYEWQAGIFEVRCPQCKSPNIRNVSN